MTKIVSWNVNGVRAVASRNLFDVFQELDADVFCLQETKATVDQVVETLAPLKGYTVNANEATKKGYSGVAIISRETPISVTKGIGIEEHDDEGRIVTAEFKDYILICGYIPNSGEGLKRLDYRAEWDKALLQYINSLKKHEKPVVITGDFNVAHMPIDLARPKENYNKTSGYTQVEIDGMTDFIQNGWVDGFRSLYPDKVQYTFWSVRFGARAKNLGWRIDYFLVDGNSSNLISDCQIHDQIIGSDHCPISLTLSI
jgi:exodeoxyribonuclease III